MRIFTLSFLTLVLFTSVSCGKKTTTTDAAEASITVPMSGNWSGTGTVATDGGAPAACSTATMTLTFTADTVTMSNVALTCNGGNVTDSATTFGYAGGILTYQGSAVGTISDTSIHASSTTGGETADLQITLQDATHITFTETVSGGGHSLAVTGAFVHQ